MNRPIAKLLLLVLAALLTIAAQAQTVPPPTYDSLEWDVADANLVVKGHITARNTEADSKDPQSQFLTVSIAVDETLKGAPGKSLVFRKFLRPGARESWEKQDGPLLICAHEARRLSIYPPFNPTTEWLWFSRSQEAQDLPTTAERYYVREVIDLKQPEATYIGFKRSTDPEEILSTARRIAKEQQGKQYVVDRVKLESRGYLNRPKEIPAMAHWGLDPPPRLDPNGAYDGSRILAGVGSKAYLWDALTGKTLLTFPCSDTVTAVAMSPDGRHAMTGSKDGGLRLWSTENGLLERTLGPLKASVTRIEFRASSDLAGEHDFYQEDPLVLTTCQMQGHMGRGANPQIQTIWNWTTGEAVFIVPGVQAEFSPNRASILSQQDYFMYWGSWLGVWQLPWDIPSFLEKFMLRSPHDVGNWFHSGHFTPSGEQVLSCESDGLKLRDAVTGAVASTLSPTAYGEAMFSRDGKRILALRDYNSMDLLDGKDGAVIENLPYGQTLGNLFHHAVFSRNGRLCLAAWWVVNAEKEQSGSLWDLDSGQELLKLMVTPIGFSPDGEAFCAVDRKRGQITVWDAETGQVLRTFPVASEPNRPVAKSGAN